MNVRWLLRRSRFEGPSQSEHSAFGITGQFKVGFHAGRLNVRTFSPVPRSQNRAQASISSRRSRQSRPIDR